MSAGSRANPKKSWGQFDDRLVDVRYREAGSLIAAPQRSANHTEILALFKAGRRDVGRFGARDGVWTVPKRPLSKGELSRWRYCSGGILRTS